MLPGGILASCTIAKALIDNNHDEHSFRVRRIALVDIAVKTQRRPGEKEAMEMTEYGKPKSRLPTLPTLFGNPFGIPTFARPRRLDSCLLIPAQLESMAAARGL
jgi:hypothetical protein